MKYKNYKITREITRVVRNQAICEKLGIDEQEVMEHTLKEIKEERLNGYNVTRNMGEIRRDIDTILSVEENIKIEEIK